MSYYIIIRGPLGCGKSTISERLSKELNAKYIAIDEVLDKYDLDKVPPNTNIPPENFIKANEIILPEVKKYLESGKPVIFDACFYYKEVIEHIENSLDYQGYVFTLKAPINTCIERDKNRANSHGEGSVIYVHSIVSEFDYGYNLDVTKPLEVSIERIIKYIHGKSKFTIGAFGIIKNEKGEFLFCHRTDKDLWNLPGGAMEKGESPWEATVREVQEETGLKVRVRRLVSIYSKPHENDLSFDFECEVMGGKLTTTNESNKVEYFAVDKLPTNTLLRHRVGIKDFMANKGGVTLKTKFKLLFKDLDGKEKFYKKLK